MKLLLAVVLLLAVPVAAGAYVAPGATIVSASLELREQGDEASSAPDISADGRYVVFETRARNLFGPDFSDPARRALRGRRDAARDRDRAARAGRARRPRRRRRRPCGCAARATRRCPPTAATSRSRPRQRLVPADINGNIDVYVRDMDAGAYELVSARDGSAVPGELRRARSRHAAAQPGRRRQPRRGDLGRRRPRAVPHGRHRLGPAGPRLADHAAVPALRARALDAADAARHAAGGQLAAGPGRRRERRRRAQRGRHDGRLARPARRPADALPRRRVRRRVGVLLPLAPHRGRPGRADAPDHGCGRARGAGLHDLRSAAGRRQRAAPARSAIASRRSTGITSTLPALSADGLRVAFTTGAPPRPSVLGVGARPVGDRHDAGALAHRGERRAHARGHQPRSAPTRPRSARWRSRRTGAGRRSRPRARASCCRALRLVDTPTTVPGLEELYVIDLEPRARVERGCARRRAATPTPASLPRSRSPTADGGSRSPPARTTCSSATPTSARTSS